MIASLLAKVTIEPVVLFYVFAIFAEYAVLEDLLYVSKCFERFNLTSDELHTCVENKKNGTEEWKDISVATNHAMLIYNGILYSTSIISSFTAAAYSDRRSKLLPILLPVIGSALVQILVLASLGIESDGIPFVFSHTFILFVCSFISGITGGTSTLLSSCFAHVAERCSAPKRTARITIVEACLFGGGFFGLTYSGAILRANPNSLSRYFYNFGIFLVIHVWLAIYVFIRRAMYARPQIDIIQQTSASSPLKTCFTLLSSVLITTFRKRPRQYQRCLIMLILCAFTLISFWNTTLTTLLFIYTRNDPLDWQSSTYSFFSSAKFALCGIFLCLLPLSQHILIDRFNRRPFSDITIILVGLLSRATSIILIGFATNSTLMIVGLAVIILAEYPIPAIRSLLTKIIEPNEKAQMFVFLATIQSLCFFLGGMILPLLYNVIYDKLHSGMIGPFNGPGLIFVAVGLLQLIAMIIFIFVDKIMAKSDLELIEHSTAEVDE